MSTTTAVKERPILFSTPMVAAILEGRKTVTRRVIKESWNGCFTNGGPHPCPNDPVVLYPGENLGKFNDDEHDTIVDYPQVRAIFHCSTLDSEAKCSYGKPGDILWVRETFTILDYWEDSKAVQVMYKDGTTSVCQLTESEWSKFINWQEKTERKPSLFMFKSLSRLKLEILSIGVERLQDITEEDAIKEGVERVSYKGTPCWKSYVNTNGFGNARDSFWSLWHSINGSESWEANVWVWVINFKKL